MKITELRLAKLFSTKANVASTGNQCLETIAKKAEGNMLCSPTAFSGFEFENF